LFRTIEWGWRPRIWLNWRWLNATRTARRSRHERDYTESVGNAITIDDERIKSHLDRVVRRSVEETLNALLDAEADRLCNAQRYERTEGRRDTRAGHYERKLQTKAGEVKLRIPKLRTQTFETAIIERYRRRESSVEEALIEMYLAGVSVRRVEDITEALWGTRVSPSTVSDLNKKIYGTIEAWRNRPIEGEHPYVYLDGIVLTRSWAGEVRNVSLLVAIAVNGEGYREILGICEGAKEDKAGWSAFLKHLKGRGLHGIRLIISDACMGLAESAAEFFPEAAWQRCIVGSLNKLAGASSEAGRVCPPSNGNAILFFGNGYACMRYWQAIQRANSARIAAASRFRLIAAAVR
jgi:putative transposase